MLVNTLLCLLQTCAERFNFCVLQKWVDTFKFQWNYVHYWLKKVVQRVHNITTSKKTTLHACKHLVMLAVNLCRKVWILRSTKVAIHFEISMKLCTLLTLESCAKGAQHHNKRNTTLHACKHLVMFAVNLCKQV